MTQISVERLKYEHVVRIIDILADHSHEEVFAAGGLCAKKMWDAIAGEEIAYAGFIGDDIVCAYGAKLGTVLTNHATMWMLVTKHANEHPFLFIRHSRVILAEIQAKFTIVRCFVSTDYKNHTKWMRLLGFHAHGLAQTDLGNFCEYRLGQANG